MATLSGENETRIGPSSDVVNMGGIVVLPSSTHNVEHGVTGPTGATGQTKRPKILAIGTTVRPSKHAGGWRAKKARNQKGSGK